jgi:uncharacterized membrane protein YbaN (DUF454 family)
VHRKVYVGLGHLSVALGVVGAFVPVMPTVDFLIVAAACYAKGNPALKRKLLAHPRFGPPIRDWEEHRAVSLRGKLLGIAMVTLGIGASILWGVNATWLRITLGVIWAAIVVLLLALKTKK